MIKVSVVIPVYNGEKYLEECLDSVCQQTLKEIEIICVDDGSTDSSYEILERYQQADDRIRLFKQQNKFAGAARNLGKANANGEFLVFWDCDDYFDLTALEKMYNRCVETEADVCVCGGKRYYDDQKKVYPWPDYMNKKKIPDTDVFNRLTNEDYILNFTNEAAWNKMFRRSYIEKLGLDFQCIRNGNDVYFTINALCLADRITCVADPLVIYRKNQSGSLVGTLTKSAKTPFQAWVDAAENLKKLDAFPEKSFVNKFCGTMIYLLRNLRTREAFCETVLFLKDGPLEKLEIKERDEEFYYGRRHAEIVHHLLNDSPEDFHDYLTFITYIQLTESSAREMLKNEEIDKKKKKINELNAEVTKQKKKVADLNAELDRVSLKRMIKKFLKATPLYPVYRKWKTKSKAS